MDDAPQDATTTQNTHARDFAGVMSVLSAAITEKPQEAFDAEAWLQLLDPRVQQDLSQILDR